MQQRVQRVWQAIANRVGAATPMSSVSRIEGNGSSRTMTNAEVTPTKGELVREGQRVRLRKHTPANRELFQRWYADDEIAQLLRHDLRPLNDRQSQSYFDTLILPMSARGLAFAIHEKVSDALIGTTALTETDDYAPDARLFRIAIGEKVWWDRGMGTDATALVLDEAFETLKLNEVRLEVFAHNPRAIAVYERVGFQRTGERYEYLGRDRPQLHVFEMSIDRDRWRSHQDLREPAPDTV